MVFTRRDSLRVVAAGLVAASTPAVTLAGEQKTTIHVEMWDMGADAAGDFDFDAPIMIGTPGVALKDRAPMGFDMDTFAVPAGEVDFTAINNSKDFEHEMIVAPWPDLSKPLPYNADAQRVDEDAAGALGEIPETGPGETGKLVLHFAPGTYVVFCNIEEHYAMGMWTVLTVT